MHFIKNITHIIEHPKPVVVVKGERAVSILHITMSSELQKPPPISFTTLSKKEKKKEYM